MGKIFKIDKDRVIEELHLRYTGTKGWMLGATCPKCNKSDKFGIIIPDEGVASFNCFRASCDNKGTLYKYLKEINRLDLVGSKEIDVSDKIENPFTKKKINDIDYSLPRKTKPLGFKRIQSDDYLDIRGFTKEQYDLFHVGVATLEPKLKDKYIIFLLYDKGEVVGYVARSKRSKEWHEKNEELAKKGLCKLVLRYENSKDTDFEKILGGYDELIPGKTKTVLIVEGLMDKANTDRQLDLYLQDEIKCCFTFGTKISDFQIKRMQDKGVENIILLYDYNTIKKSQQYSMELNDYFNTKIGEIIWPKEDPGSMDLSKFMYVLERLKDPMDYNINRLDKKLLKF